MQAEIDIQVQTAIDTITSESQMAIDSVNQTAQDITNLFESASADFVRVGTIITFCSLVIPPTYLICDGSTFNEAFYPELFITLGNSNVLPDLRG